MGVWLRATKFDLAIRRADSVLLGDERNFRNVAGRRQLRHASCRSAVIVFHLKELSAVILDMLEGVSADFDSNAKMVRRDQMLEDTIKGIADIIERCEKYYDPGIARNWLELARRHTCKEVVTNKGLAVSIYRVRRSNSVRYEGFIAGRSESIASVDCRAPFGGRVCVLTATVVRSRNADYRRNGIASAMLDVIEDDVRICGGEGIEPNWGQLSESGLAFWIARVPQYGEDIRRLNDLGQAASGLFIAAKPVAE